MSAHGHRQGEGRGGHGAGPLHAGCKSPVLLVAALETVISELRQCEGEGK